MPTLGLNRPTLEGKWRGTGKKGLYTSSPAQLQPEKRLFFLLGAWFLVRTWVAEKAPSSRAWRAVGQDHSEAPFSAPILSGLVTSSKLQFGRLSGCLRHQGISRWFQGRVSFLKTLKQAQNSQSPPIQRWPCSFEGSSLQPILTLHFLGMAPSSLHAGPPQLTALSAVLI